jgi:phosphoserine phosphatase
MTELIIGSEPQWLQRPDRAILFRLTLCGDGLKQSIDGVFVTLAAMQIDVSLADHQRNESRCSITFESSPGTAWSLFQTLRQQLSGIDMLVLPVEQLEKRLLICDMDMTIVAAETLDEVAAVLGMGDRIAAITERAMRGEIDFNDALRERIAMLEGCSVAAFDEVAQQLELNPGAQQLFDACKDKGVHTILISGGFTQVVEAVAQRLGFDEWYCNQLQIDQGCLTGKVIDPIVNAELKSEILRQRAPAMEIDLADCCAIGDGANDRLMIEAAGLGIAYHAKPVLRTATHCQINNGGLDTAIHFMGL